MIVNKTCVLNSVEPSPLSFRAPMGLDTSLNVVFYGQDGQPYPSDLGAQLQLTGRSTARTSTYFMPATDIANGRARAVIPGGDISDVNGYRLRIVGTWKGEPALLALGTLATVAAAGLETVPEDVIDTIDLNLTYGNPVTMIVKLWQDAGKNIHVWIEPNELEAFMDALNPEGVMLHTTAGSVEEADDLVKRVSRWTKKGLY